MTNIELQDLKLALAQTHRKDVESVIKNKELNASYTGGSIGTSLHGNDSIFIDLLVDHIKSERILKVQIHFMNNENELFDESKYIDIDRQAGIYNKRLKPLDRARLRVMWIVYKVVLEVSRNLCQAAEDCAKGKADKVYAELLGDSGRIDYHN